MVHADAAELTAHNLNLMSGETSRVVVSGRIAGELTFGVNIMVEIVPRAGATGVVRFTPAPPVDIVQLGDPWPGLGVFNWFDTDVSYSEALNGSVDGDGIFIPTPVTFSGDLVMYPVEAGAGARGVWDLRLSTSVGDSFWDGLATTLTPGTLTVPAPEDIPTMSTWSVVILTLLLTAAGTIVIVRKS